MKLSKDGEHDIYLLTRIPWFCECRHETAREHLRSLLWSMTEDDDRVALFHLLYPGEIFGE